MFFCCFITFHYIWCVFSVQVHFSWISTFTQFLLSPVLPLVLCSNPSSLFLIHSYSILLFSILLPSIVLHIDLLCSVLYCFISSCLFFAFISLCVSVLFQCSNSSPSFFPSRIGSVQFGSLLSCTFCILSQPICTIPLVILDTLDRPLLNGCTP